MVQLGFSIDMANCSGCRCCQVACKDKKNMPVGAFFRQVLDYEGGVFPATWAASLSLACNHCMYPECAKNCPVAAPKKQEDTGLVLQDIEMCIGCGKCIVSCPYGAPTYIPEEDVVRKCDGCIDLVAIGESPACVAACSTRCLQFDDIEQLGTFFSKDGWMQDIAGLPDSGITNPSLRIKPKKEMLE